MFSQACVKNCVHGGGGVSQYALGIHPRPDTPPRRPLQRTVRILLECILVFFMVFYTYIKVCYFKSKLSKLFVFSAISTFNDLTSVLILDPQLPQPLVEFYVQFLVTIPWAGPLSLIEFHLIDRQSVSLTLQLSQTCTSAHMKSVCNLQVSL